jgi:hypothetical protein
MTDPLTIAAGDRHGLYVFALDAPLSVVNTLKSGNNDAGPHPLAALFGVSESESRHVEVINPADLGELGLSGYLIDGHGVPAPQIAPDKGRLDALTGPVLLLAAKAFDGRQTTLHLDPRLDLIGSYAEEVPPVFFEPLPSAAAQGTLNPMPPATKPTGIPTAFLLLGAALLITGLAAGLLAMR